MAIRWAAGASNHGVSRNDALQAIAHHFLHVPAFDAPSGLNTGRLDLYIGPPRQLGAPLVEVMVEVLPSPDLLIFHAMLARPRYLALLGQGE